MSTEIPAGAEVEIRNMSRTEVDIAIEWARQEGWNPGIYDAEPFFAADPEGFFIATHNGTPVGCISAVAYDDRFAFGGFYIVDPEFRGKGVGMKLWKHALGYLGSRTMGGDGVIERLDDYAREGFRLAYSNVRFQGKAAPKPFEEVTEASSISFAKLLAYDRKHFPAQREAFLRAWIEQPETLAYCVQKGDVITGFGVIRKCFEGWKVGPLFADLPGTAERLLRALTDQIAGETIFLDVPEPNAAGMAMAARWHMKPVFKTGRIYNGPAPELPLSNIFSVTSFELG